MLLLCFASLGLLAILILAMLDSRRTSFFGVIVPWERRRPVPWNGWDVVFLFVLYFLLMNMSFNISHRIFETPPIDGPWTSTAEHPLTQLLQQGKGAPFILFVAFFSGVLAAPLSEEFLFRVVLQGWLEKAESFATKGVRRLHGISAVVLTSTLFAALHGGGRQEQSVDTLLPTLFAVGVANTLFPILAAVFLRIGRQATWTDLGLRFHRLPSDIASALLFAVLVIPPIFFLHNALQGIFPKSVTDPAPIFFFAVALGFLFYRTHRLTSCVMLHVVLNATSFLLLTLKD